MEMTSEEMKKALINWRAPDMPEAESPVGSNALFAENASLRESLKDLLALYDDFKDGDDQCFEDAYHSFYKGQYDKWEKARNLLATRAVIHKAATLTGESGD